MGIIKFKRNKYNTLSTMFPPFPYVKAHKLRMGDNEKCNRNVEKEKITED